MAAPVCGSLGNVLARRRCRRRRSRWRPEQWRDHTEHEGGGARRHGDGDYLFYGHGQRRPSQSSCLAFAARRNFPWSRTPGYIAAQLVGGMLAAWFLRSMFGIEGLLGATTPGAHISDFKAFVMEVLLTTGLVSTILGTASGARNVGSNGALAVGGYIALAGTKDRGGEGGGPGERREGRGRGNRSQASEWHQARRRRHRRGGYQASGLGLIRSPRRRRDQSLKRDGSR